MVNFYIPNSTAASFMLKPLARNPAITVVMLAVGAIKLLEASINLETLPSLRPVSTSHRGPLV